MNKIVKILAFIMLAFSINSARSQGNVLNFDGNNDYVSLNGLATPLANDNTYTVEFWMKADISNQTFVPVLFAINNLSGNVQNENLITLSIQTGGPFDGELVVSYAQGNNQYGGVNIADNNCHHIAYVRNVNSADVYIDGNLVLSGINTNPTVQGANSVYSLGQEFDPPFNPFITSQFYNGDLDNIKIWNDVRSPSEIITDMTATPTGPTQGLVAYYHCNQGNPSGNNGPSGLNITQLTDAIGGFHGTLNNFTLNGNTSNFIADPLTQIQLSVTSLNQTPCDNESVPLIATASGTGITAWSWTNLTTQTAAGNTQNITVLPPDATYQVNGTAGVCQVVLPASIHVDFDPAPTFTATVNSPLCEGDPINITTQITSIFRCGQQSWQWYENSSGTPTAIPGETSSQLTLAVNNYPAGTEFSVTLCCSNGCCETITAGKTNAYPTASLSSMTIDFCDWDGDPIQLDGNGSGLNCGYNGPVSGLNVNTGEFDPSVSGVGFFPISYYCDNGGCYTEVAAVVTVIEDGSWHQSTINTQGKESANDVITDSQGNVYVTGEYEVRTTLDGGSNQSVTMNTSTSAPEKHSYTAKYDECANLLWANYSTTEGPGAINWGTSITLDETNDYVYCVGNFTGEMNYEGPFGDPLTIGAYNQISISSSGPQEGYVVRMKMSDGEIQYLDPVQAGKITELRAVTINEGTGAIFVGGHKNGPQNAGEDRAFVNKYSPVSNNGPLNWQFIDVRDGNSYINDMDFNESQNGLWAVGEYDLEVEFDGLSGGTPIFNNNIGVLDAFVLYVDAATPSQNFLIKGNSDGLMTGRGIAIDESNGYAFVTGSYENAISDPFQLGGYVLPNNLTSNAYFVAIDDNANSPWNDARYADVTSFEAKGVAVAFKDDQVYFTGTYTRNVVFSGSSPYNLPYSAAGGFAGLEHIYLVNYDSNGEPVWANGTKDPYTYTSIHNPTAVSADQNGNAFIVGNYSGDMGYLQGNPASGVLTSTGSPAVKINAFIMRSDLLNGGFKSQIPNTTNQVIAKSEDGIALSLAPNPTSNLTTLSVVDYDPNLTYNFVLYGIEGKVLVEGQLEANGIAIDLNDYQAGIYFVKVSNGTQIEVAKVLKVNQ